MATGTRVYLASKSPRRRHLLAEAGIEHEVVPGGIDDAELVPGGVTPRQWVAALAYLKAAAARDRLGAAETSPCEAVVIGADTIVYKHGRILGQPRSAEEAAETLRLLENGQHRVMTGVCLLDPVSSVRSVFVDEASVRVGPLGEERIGEYVATGGWAGKAGGYNLSERLADGWPIEFEGDPTTIMGLPMAILPSRLAAFVEQCAERVRAA